MTRKRRRLYVVLACGLGLGSATALTLSAFSRDLVFFVTPADLLREGHAGNNVRLGGLVEAGSVTRTNHGGAPVAVFRVTDGQASVTVHYAGILPDLFREGQGVVALGHMTADGFVAEEVLAKHDEKYMPRDLADALKKNGHWTPGGAAAGS